MNLTKNQQRSVYELILAGSLWGFGFVAVPLAQGSFNSFEICFLRFFIPLVLWMGIATAFPKMRLSISLLKKTFIPGFFLAATLIPQTLGLLYTTATKSSFITTLYVLLVPVVEFAIFRRKPSGIIYLSLLLALLGAGLLVNLDFTSWNFGDSLTLLCAIMSAFHILSLDKFHHPNTSAFHLNMGQAFWVAALTLPFVIYSEFNSGGAAQPFILTSSALSGLLILAIGPSFLAFSLQIRAQAHLNPTQSSILFLLEAPFAMFFARVILNEQPNATQLSGAFLILVACSLVILIPRRKQR